MDIELEEASPRQHVADTRPGEVIDGLIDQPDRVTHEAGDTDELNKTETERKQRTTEDGAHEGQ